MTDDFGSDDFHDFLRELGELNELLNSKNCEFNRKGKLILELRVYHLTSRLTATLNLYLIYLKLSTLQYGEIHTIKAHAQEV